MTSRREFLQAAGAAAIGQALPPEWKTIKDETTGRTVRLLTTARANSYPLYYFIPSASSDGRYVVFHSERSGWVQLYRLDMQSGAIAQLSDGRTRDCGWFIWCEPHLRGVFNHLAALNTVRREVFYFQDEEVRATNLDTLANRLVRRIPGRYPLGQTSFSPDGTQFAYIHAEAEMFRRAISDREALQNMGMFGWAQGHQAWRNATPTTISVIDVESGAQRDVIKLDYHVHHVLFPRNGLLLVNHPRNDAGMWTIRTDGGGYRHLRPRDDHGAIVHQVLTERGIFYEAAGNTPGARNWFGCYDLDKHTHREVLLPAVDGYVHTGWDPAGRFLFFEHHGKTHELASLHFPFDEGKKRLRRLRTIAPYPRPGQRYHAHPFLSPDRKWMIYTEVIDGFSQVCALDVQDLVDLNEYWPG